MRNIMSTPIVSADARTRLQEAVKNYTPPAPEKYRALEEVKDCIVELRAKKASYQTITTMLRDAAGLEVSHQTVARYCREVLQAKHTRTAKLLNRTRAAQPPPTHPAIHAAADGQPSATQRELLTSTPASSAIPPSRARGPSITHVKDP